MTKKKPFKNIWAVIWDVSGEVVEYYLTRKEARECIEPGDGYTIYKYIRTNAK